MRYPAKVFIQGNTQKPGRSLVFNNGLANVNGRQRTNNPVVFEKIYSRLFIPNCTRNHVINYTKGNDMYRSCPDFLTLSKVCLTIWTCHSMNLENKRENKSVSTTCHGAVGTLFWLSWQTSHFCTLASMCLLISGQDTHGRGWHFPTPW